MSCQEHLSPLPQSWDCFCQGLLYTGYYRCMLLCPALANLSTSTSILTHFPCQGRGQQWRVLFAHHTFFHTGAGSRWAVSVVCLITSVTIWCLYELRVAQACVCRLVPSFHLLVGFRGTNSSFQSRWQVLYTHSHFSHCTCVCNA